MSWNCHNIEAVEAKIVSLTIKAIKMKLILVFLAVFASFVGVSQDKIMLLSGKVLQGKILSSDTSGVNYQYTKKGKPQVVVLDHYRIYSLDYANGNSEVIYKRDSIAGRNYTVKQMGAFVAGERYAFEHFNGTGTVIYGVLTGALSGLLIKGSSIFVAPAVIAFGFTTLIPPPKKINPEDVVDKELLKEKYFLEGYKRVIRSKRLGRGMVSALGGAVIGVTIALLTN